MMPLGDDDSERKTVPIVTYGLIILNILFFLVELTGGEQFVMQWAFIPQRFTENPAANFPTFFTSMFMHAGWMHLVGNMLYLWIFGDNVEDYLGKVKFIFFYLLSGIAAVFAQYAVSPHSTIPNVGASGAIAGVLAAYLLFFPSHRVSVLVGQSVVQMSAFVVIGMWFFLQLVSGAGALFSTHAAGEEGGVAYMAHVGGFLAGLAVAILFRITHPSPTSKA